MSLNNIIRSVSQKAGFITMCPAVVGNLLVYRDQSHLSVEYSTWLAPVITNFLIEAEPRASG